MATKSATRWGISIPQHFLTGPVDVPLIHRFVTRAEALGYHSIWVQERVVSNFAVMEPVSLLCYVAALTSRVRLGSSVIISALRNPGHFARLLASLDQLSTGRLIVGVGLGNSGRDYPAFGLTAEGRVRRFIEGIELMKAMWTQPSVTHRGEFWQLDDFQMEPKPFQKPHPPIWFGAHLPLALKRAVRHGNGWMGAGNSTTAQFKEESKLILGYLEEAKQDPATFAISKRVYIAVDRESAQAKQRMEQFFGRVYGSAARGGEVSVWGTVDQCVEGLNEVLSMEPELVLLTPVTDHIEQMETLWQDVIPRLQ